MAQVEGLNLRGSRYYVRVIIPDDLRDAYGRQRVNLALGTSDRKEATLLAILKRAHWLAEFASKRAARSPSLVPSITPDLASLLADMVRSHVLSEDDRVRADVGLLAEMVHVRRELDHKAASPLRIPQWTPSESREDDLSGLTTEEAEELAGLNAYLDGRAAMAMAGGNLRAVLPLVQELAGRLGLHFDPKTPGAREALGGCLRAYRKAHHERTLRDTGEAVETPPMPSPVVPLAGAPNAKPKTLRDVFERWERSGAEARSADSVRAMDRALRQFEGQHPGLALHDISRSVGDLYRAWLIENCKTSKTARDRLTGIKTLLKYAATTLEWTARHTWVGLDIKARTTAPRRPLSDAELCKLFGTELHTRYALPKVPKAGRDAAYWIPLLGAFTGARLGELCQLRTVDIQTVDDIPVLVLTDDGEGQTIKSAAGRRTVPIHSELIRLGFLDHARATQEAGHDSLWPSLAMRKGKPSDYFGRWFREFREGLGLHGPGLPTFHYFRHTVRPLMRRAGVSESTQDKVTGHETQGSVGTVVYDHWHLRELQEAVEAIKYPCLGLPRVTPHGAP